MKEAISDNNLDVSIDDIALDWKGELTYYNHGHKNCKIMNAKLIEYITAR